MQNEPSRQDPAAPATSRRNRLEKLELRGAGTHAGLWLDRFLRSQARTDDEARRRLVQEVASIPIPESYPLMLERWKEALETAGAVLKQGVVQNRMVVGLGGESALETHITLHRTYGVPYIPGSALKGLAAAFARQRLGAAWSQQSDAYQILFGGTTSGNTTSAGFVTFFDALPLVKTGTGTSSQPAFGARHPLATQLQKRAVAGSLLEPDVLTVHHAAYYMGTRDMGTGDAIAAPADWDNPNPVSFLSAVGSYLLALQGPDEWVQAAFNILAQALEEAGIGAKTSSGYGRMKVEPL